MQGWTVRVLLISPNTEMLPDPVFPLGLAYVSASLEANQHEHRVLDLCFVEDYAQALEQAVAEFDPQAIGLSLRNVDNVAYPNSFSYLPFYRQIMTQLRGLSAAPIILGGSGFSLMPRELLTYLQADFGVFGEGEQTLPRLLDHLQQGLPPGGIPGVIGRDSIVRQLLSPPVLSTREMFMPCRDRFANEQYLRFGGMGNIQTKRGCSFSCIYCTYPLIEGREVRLRRPGDVVKEIEHLCRGGIDSFFVVDNVFNFPPHHAKSICQEVLKRGLKVRWSCYLHPQFVTESLLTLMKEAGCSSVEFGVDAGADVHLMRLGKSFGATEIRRASDLCHRVGLPFCHSLVFGGPGEDRDTIEATLELMGEVSPTAVIAMIGIRLFPGTRLAQVAAASDCISSDQAMIEPTFYLAETVRSYILDLLRDHAAQQRHWILPGANVNISPRLQEKLRRFGLKGPLWEHMQIRRK
jgi:radical SAM superfamily enzyme YgiQ (UPF0313 family)